MLCPQALHPAQHAELKARLQEGQARRRIERALDALSAALSARGLSADLSGRPKNLWGVFGKMAAKGYGLESVYDVRALRVIVSSKADCYEALRQVLRCATEGMGTWRVCVLRLLLHCSCNAWVLRLCLQFLGG